MGKEEHINNYFETQKRLLDELMLVYDKIEKSGLIEDQEITKNLPKDSEYITPIHLNADKKEKKKLEQETLKVKQLTKEYNLKIQNCLNYGISKEKIAEYHKEWIRKNYD